MKAIQRRILNGIPWKADSSFDSIANMVSLYLILVGTSSHSSAGVVKTHKLLLSTATHLMSPSEPDGSNETTLTIGPRALRDILEHFSPSRGAKHDPQLIWTFKETEVTVKTLKSSLDLKGSSHIYQNFRV